MRSPALLCLVALCASPALADVVHLKGGGRLVGRVEQSGDEVRVELPGCTMTIPKDRVESIERKETPVDELARLRAALSPGDSAAAMALADRARDAGLSTQRGELLTLAATWAPANEKIRDTLASWRVFERPLPENPSAQAALAAVAGRGAEIYVTPHWRIAYGTDLAVARRRGEMLEAAWRKFRGLAERAGIVARPIEDRMECVVFSEHADWLKAAGLPADDVTELTGLYVGATRRVLLFDTRTSPVAKSVDRAVTGEIEALAQARTELERQETAIARIEQALRDGLAAQRKDEAHIVELKQWLDGARKAVAMAHDEIDARATALERYRTDTDRHFAQENVSSTTHEACHQIAFALGVSRPDQPTWLVEGLATLFEPQSRTTFVLEARNAGRQGDLRAAWAKGKGGSLRRVLTDAVFADRADGPLAYAESWSLTYFLANRRSANFARYLAQAASIASGGDTAAARVADFTRCFGADLDAIEREWRVYVSRL